MDDVRITPRKNVVLIQVTEEDSNSCPCLYGHEKERVGLSLSQSDGQLRGRSWLRRKRSIFCDTLPKKEVGLEAEPDRPVLGIRRFGEMEGPLWGGGRKLVSWGYSVGTSNPG